MEAWHPWNEWRLSLENSCSSAFSLPSGKASSNRDMPSCLLELHLHSCWKGLPHLCTQYDQLLTKWTSYALHQSETEGGPDQTRPRANKAQSEHGPERSAESTIDFSLYSTWPDIYTVQQDKPLSALILTAMHNGTAANFIHPPPPHPKLSLPPPSHSTTHNM